MRLTWKEAYRAAYGFLDDIWEGVTGEDQELLAELDTFLGGMMLQEDDTATDPAIMDLWHKAAAQVTRSNGWSDMTEEEAYQTMVLFLDLWARDNSDGTILGICRDLSRTGPERDGWDKTVQKVLNGEFDPYFGLTGEGYEEVEGRLTLIYLVTGDMILTKKPYTDWREVQAEYMGYQSSLRSQTCEELADFFAGEYGDEEDWPISRRDLQGFFESSEETLRLEE